MKKMILSLLAALSAALVTFGGPAVTAQANETGQAVVEGNNTGSSGISIDSNGAITGWNPATQSIPAAENTVTQVPGTTVTLGTALAGNPTIGAAADGGLPAEVQNVQISHFYDPRCSDSILFDQEDSFLFSSNSVTIAGYGSVLSFRVTFDQVTKVSDHGYQLHISDVAVLEAYDFSMRDNTQTPRSLTADQYPCNAGDTITVVTAGASESEVPNRVPYINTYQSEDPGFESKYYYVDGVAYEVNQLEESAGASYAGTASGTTTGTASGTAAGTAAGVTASEAALPTDGNRIVLTGTINQYTYDQVVAMQGVPDPNAQWSSKDQMYHLIVLDTPQVLTLNTVDEMLSSREVKLIVVRSGDHQYDGQHISFSIDSQTCYFPSDTSLPLGSPGTRDLHILSVLQN